MKKEIRMVVAEQLAYVRYNLITIYHLLDSYQDSLKIQGIITRNF